ALEHEAVTTQFQTVARLHAQVTLAVEQTGTDHTDRTYRDADMGHHHAPVTARQRADAAHQTLVAGLVEDVACRTADHPQHQEQHAADPQEVVTYPDGADHRPDRCQHQHPLEHADQPL